jgi:hypothetical protein
MKHKAPRFHRSQALCLLSLLSSLANPTVFAESPEPAFIAFPESTPSHAAALASPKTAGRPVTPHPNLASLSRVGLELTSQTTLQAERTRLEDKGNGDFVWVGRLLNEPLSEVIFVSHEGAFAAQINRPLEDGNAIYTIEPNTEGVPVLSFSEPIDSPDGCTLPPPTQSRRLMSASAPGQAAALQKATFATASAANPATIDILVVYTPATTKKHGGKAGAESLIVGAIASANNAYRNSAIFINLNLVYVGEVAYTEPNSTGISLARLAGVSDGHLEDVPTLREKYGADLVVLVSQDSNNCGTSYQSSARDASFSPWAYSVVFSGCIGQYTLTHEIGHSMGCNHDRDNPAGYGAYPYSYGHKVCTKDGKGYRTVMSYACSGVSVPRVNYFSNPEILFNGVPTGVPESDTAKSADNARSLNQNAHAVAAFRSRPAPTPPPVPVPTQLAGSATSSRVIQLGWNESASDESGFELERSLDGTVWTRLATLPPNTRAYTDSTGSPGATFLYRIRTCVADRRSEWSEVARITTPDPIPNAPTGFALRTTGSGEITVSWVDQSDNEIGFEIQRTSGGLTFEVIAITPANATSFVNKSLKPRIGYAYRIRAVGKTGASAWSAVRLSISR